VPLQVVDAHYNKLRSCPQDLLGCINNLLVLNLSYNRLDSWPAGLHMPALVVLDLSFNKLQQLPEDMGQQLPALQDLYMANNFLTGLPDSLSRLELRDMFVSENDFQVVPKVSMGLSMCSRCAGSMHVCRGRMAASPAAKTWKASGALTA
jgi:Leucine-rich repeat (LRR) protein